MHAVPPPSHWSCQVLFVSFESVGSKAMSSLYVTILHYVGLHLLLCLQIKLEKSEPQWVS